MPELYFVMATVKFSESEKSEYLHVNSVSASN